jgi:hypothetical protein
MRHRTASIPLAVMFFVFAAAFSVIFWPEVSLAAKIAFFATGVGCGIAIGRFTAERRQAGG